MRSRSRVLRCLYRRCCGSWNLAAILFALTAAPCLAQEASEPAGVGGSTGNVKALKYFRVLQKRPSPGYLFDRFYNAWLDTDTVEGLESFLEGTVASSETTANRLLLAFFYTRQGENVKALEQFRSALEKDPGSADAWYQKALVEQRTLDFETAIKDLNRALAAVPREELERDILQLKGRLHARSGDAGNARASWSALLARHPDDEDLQEDLIELQLTEGLYEQAEETALALIAKTKDPYLAVVRRLRLGDIHQNAGKREKALESYGASLERVGSETWIEKEIIGQIEQVFRREDDITGLKTHLGKLLESHPKRIGLRRKYVAILTELGERDEAKKQFSEILKLTPGDRGVREDYVDMLAKLELRDEAITQLKSLIELHAEDGELLVKLAALQHGGGDSSAAKATVELFLARSDSSEYSHLRAVRLLERFEQVEAADGVFQKLLARFPDSEGARDAYAAYLHRHGRKEEAISTWKELATGGDREKVVRVARALSSRTEYGAAFELLEARFGDFSGDSIFLKQLIDVALRLQKFEEASPWVRELVRSAETPSDLDTAVTLAVRVASRLEREDQLRLELQTSTLAQEQCLLAELYETNGEIGKATAVLDGLRQSGDEKVALMAVGQKIRLYVIRQEFQHAAEATEELLAMPGGRRTANVQRAVELYRRAFLHEKALEWIPTWKTLSPGSTTPWLTEARLLLGFGASKKAVEVLRRATQEFEGNQDVRAMLADVYAEDGKLADATRIYNQLYDEATDVASKIRWVEDLARVAEQRGKSRELIERFEERRRTNRTSVVPLLALAEIHRVAGRYEDRRRALLEATRVKPDDLELLLQIARIEEAEQEFERALVTLESALGVAGAKRDRVLERIARLHFSAGDEDKGLEVLHDLVGRENLDPKSGVDLAQAMLSMGDWAQASEFIAPLRERFPDDYRFGYLHAVALEEDEKNLPALEAFIALLGVDQELPARPGAPNARRQSRNQNVYYDMLRKIAPSGTVDLMMLQRYSYQAYRYRHQRSRMSGMANLSFIAMPVDLEELRRLALAHISSIAQRLDENGLEEVRGLLSAAGVSYGKYILELDVSQSFRQGFGPELLEKFQDDGAILAVVMLNQQGTSVIDLPILKKAFGLFRERWPELAYMAGMSAALHEGEEAQLLAQEAFVLMESLESPTYFSTMSALFAVGNPQFGRGAESFLSDEQKKQLMAKLTQWYAADDASPWTSYLFTSIAGSMVQSGDYAGFVRFLDDEIERPVRPGMNPNRFYRRSNQLLQSPDFPPTMLADFPPQVLGLMQPGRSPFGSMGVELDAEALSKHLDGIRSPILQVLLLQEVEELGAEEGRVEAALEALVSAEEPELDAFLLAAAYRAVHRDDPAGAIELAKRARFLPMTREQRQSIDGAIVSWSLEAKSGSEPEGDPVVASGREAALRLRRVHLSPEHREELIAALEELGMSKEAEKLEALPAVASQRSGMRRMVSSRRRGSGSQTRVQSLLTEGKREQALRLLARDLKRFSQTDLQAQTVFNNRWEVRQWVEQISGQGLARELLTSVDPGETTSPRRLAEWGYACELLGEREKATAVYRQVVAARPRDVAVRFRLIVLLLEQDLKEAQSLIGQLETRDLSLLGERCGSLLGEDQIPYSSRMEIMETLILAVASRDDLGRFPPHWVANLLEQLAHNTYAEGVDLGTVYDDEDAYTARHSRRDDTRNARARELRDFRRHAHDRACRALLDVPQLAREGFRRLSAFSPPDGTHDDMAGLARQALLTEDRSNNMFRMRYFYSRSNASRVLRLWSPEDYIVRHFWARKDRGTLDTEIRSALAEKRGAGTKAALRALDDRVELFFCEPEAFADVAKRIVRRQGQAMQSPQDQGQGLMTVIDAWRARQLEVDISSHVADAVERTKTRGGGLGSALLEYVLALHERDGGANTRQVVDQLATLYFGAQERRAARFKKHLVGNQQGGMIYSELQAGLQMLRELGQHEALFYPVADYFSDEVRPLLGAEASNWRIRPDEHPLMQNQAYADFDATRKLLDASPFVASGDAVRVYLWDEQNPRNCFFSRVASSIQGQSPALKRKYLRYLESKQTLGADLLATLADSRPKSWEGFFSKHEAALRENPESRVTTFIGATVRGRSESDFVNAKTSAQTKAALAWLKSQQSGGVLEEIDALLAARTVRALGVRSHRLPREARRYLQALLPDDRARAVQVVWKIVELVERENRSGRSVSSWGRGGSAGLIEYILQNAFSRGEASLDALNFLYDLANSEDAPGAFLMPQENSLNLRSTFQGLVQQGPSKETDAERLLRLADAFAEAVEPKYYKVSIGPQFQLVAAAVPGDAARLKAVLPALEARVGSGPHADLARELHFVVTLAAHERDVEASHPGELAAQAAQFVEHLDDSSIPLVLRLETASVVMGRSGQLLPFSATARALALAVEAWNEKIPLDERSIRRLTEHLLSDRHEKDEAWKQSAGEFLVAWKKNVLYGKRDPQRQRQNELDSREAVRMVQVCVHLEDGESMNQILSRASGVEDGSLLTLLLRLGTPEQVSRMVVNNWANMDWRVSRSRSESLYSEEIAAQLPGILKEIENPELKLFVEAFVLSLPDPKAEESSSGEAGEGAAEDKSEEATRSPRDGRLVAFAGRAGQHEFQNPMLRDAVLSFVVESELAGDVIAEAVRSAGSEIRPVMFVDGRSGGPTQVQLQQKRKLFEAYLRRSLRSGPEVMLRLVDEMAEVRWSDSWQRVQATRQLLDTFHQEFQLRAGKWSSAVRRANVSVWAKVVSANVTREMLDDSSFSRHLGVGLLYSALEGDEALLAYDEALAGLDAGIRETLTRNSGFSDAVLSALPGAVEKRELTSEERIRLIRALHGHAVFAEAAQKRRSRQGVLRSFRDAKLVTDDELLELAPALIRETPRGGHAAAELAELHTRAKRHEAAAAAYGQALAHVAADDTRDFSRFHIARARSLKEADKPVEALASLEAMDRERLDAESEITFENLFLELRLAASVAAGNERETVALASQSYLEAAKERRDEGEIARLGVALETLGTRFRKDGEHARASAYLYLAVRAFEAAEDEVTGAAEQRLDVVSEELSKTQSAMGKIRAPLDIVERGSTWKYLDAGKVPGKNWHAIEFDDSDWNEGRAKFGYGDGNEVTTLDYGSDPRNKPLTTYYRRMVELEAIPDVTAVVLSLLRDDGAVIYVNGQEIARDNMPGGAIDSTIAASRTVASRNEGQYFKHEAIDLSQVLVSGKNVVAVELHQANARSSDAGFDLDLRANVHTLGELLETVETASIESTLGNEVWSAFPPNVLARLMPESVESSSDPAQQKPEEQ